MKRTLFIVTLLLLLLTACSGRPRLIYQVSGPGERAQVAYRDFEGDLMIEIVELPWRYALRLDDPFSYEVSVEQLDGAGGITCLIEIDGEELGQVTGVNYAECSGDYAEGVATFRGRFDQRTE
ncbi:MAG: hypothetical protein KC425_02795 [Anaerolineales bacterium]|nr:hypothetical protein [Anaerolineales bacterium]